MIMEDFFGNILEHGDRVVTIRKNGRAVGGDLVYAYVDLSDGFKLTYTLGQNHCGGLYKRYEKTKIIKVLA